MSNCRLLLAWSLVLFLCFPGAAVVSASTSSASSAQPPPFLSHIDSTALAKARAVAQRRHDRDAQQSLIDYPTDAVSSVTIDKDFLNSRTFQTYRIQAPGALPDFVKELERSIHVTTLFSHDECQGVIKDAEEFVAAQGGWGLLPSGQYEISGVWIKDVPAVRDWFCRACRERLFPLFQRLYPDFVDDPNDLCVDHAYLFKYTPETGRRTDVHVDCGCLSFTIALNSPDEYEGGGTWFEGLEGLEDGGNVLKMEEGQVTMRPGGVKHAGCATEGGARYIIGGFMMNRKKVETVRMLLNKDAATSNQEQQKLLEAAVVLNPVFDTCYNLLANSYEEAGDKVKARQVLEYGLEHAHPGSGDLAYSLGSICMEQKDFHKAVDCMKICLDMDDCDIDALTTMASAYAGLGNAEQEKSCYERVIKAPAASPKRVASAYCNLGVLHEGSDNEIEFYQKSLQIVPDTFAAWYSLGAAYGTREQWQEAVDAFRASLEYAENDENKLSALQSLYKAAKFLIQSEMSAAPPSQEELLQRFQNVMGPENYQQLAASMGRR